VRSASLLITAALAGAALVACASSPAPGADVPSADAVVADITPGGDVVDAGTAAVGVYSEFLSYGDVRAALPALARRGAALTLALPAARIGDADLAALLRDAAAAGVEVRAWLLLDRDQGYWPNETNLDVYGVAARRLLDWLTSDGLRVGALVFDMEPAYAYSEQLRAALAQGYPAALALMRTHRDPAAFAQARAQLAALVGEVQARGVRATCVTYPQVVDDLDDGDDDLQDALDVPVRGIGWDELAFMVYQSTFAEAAHQWLGPGLIRSYGLSARQGFGERAVVALGTVGTAGIFDAAATPAYTDPDTLAQDVGAARGAGITRVEVYSLDGMLALGGADRWLDATRAGPRTVGVAGTVGVVRGLARSLDADLGTSGDAGADADAGGDGGAMDP
jgi:hypothetical protein